MGRDVTGIRTDKKPNAVSIKSNGISHDTVHVSLQTPRQSSETNDTSVEDHTVEKSVGEDYQEKPDVVGAEIINADVSLPKLAFLKPDTPKSSEKTLSAPLKAASESVKASEKTLKSPVKSDSASVAAGNFQKDSNVSQSYSPVTEKQASNAIVDTSANRTSNTKDSHSPKNAKKLEPYSPPVARKLHQSDYKCYPDDEDNWSMASSAAASVRTAKSVTVPIGPSFLSAQRVSKRREYYAKLEEKRRALEEEKKEYEARMKEEQAAAIRQLRKNMAVKASPVPSFYREGPPPKVELKKLPVTRAKSPNLTRRKSCGDATHSPLEKGACCSHGNRHSLGVYKEGNTNGSSIRSKNQINRRNENGTCKVCRCKLETEKSKTSPLKPNEQRISDTSAES